MVKSLESQLAKVNWFSNAGLRIAGKQYHPVASWENAFEFVEHEVTAWATVEARNVLYNGLHDRHAEVFRTWNLVAANARELATRFIADAHDSYHGPVLPSGSKQWLVALLIGALMEERFDDYVSVTLFRNLCEFLIAGHFPCGWYVRKPGDFPGESLPIVF